ncbi:MAG: hypothetical protein ILO53_05545 [Clostridia bacterium]|nr:hypothetical protein [Clostridia bacterium]
MKIFKPTVISGGVCFFIVALVLAAAIGAFAPVDAEAAGYSFVPDWQKREYDTGENVDIKISIAGLEGAGELSGSLDVDLQGLLVSLVEPLSGFRIVSDYDNGRISITTDGTGSVIPAGSVDFVMLHLRVTEDREPAFSLSGFLSEGSTSGMIPHAKYEIKHVPLPATEAPSESPAGPGQTTDPEQSGAPETEKPTGTPAPTETPTATPTMAVIETPGEATAEPSEAAETPEATEGRPGIIEPGEYSGENNNRNANPISTGAVVFWAFVALVAGIWIGIAIGAGIWKKKAIFVTDDEKRIIGKR